MADRFLQVVVDAVTDLDDLTHALLQSVLRHQLNQSVLYRAPEGAALWSQMTRDGRSSMGSVWGNFDLGGPCDRLAKEVGAWIQRLRSRGRSKSRTKIGVIVPGCGDGLRESRLCRSLLQADRGLCLKVGCIDLSTVLLYKAANELGELGPRCEVIAGHFDFENPSLLSAFRDAHFADLPLVVLFIGNTLGNVDDRQMMSEFASILRAQDLLIIEALLHDADQVSRLLYERKSAEDDPRAQFLLNPLRLLGINPTPAQLFVECCSEEGGRRLARRYSYVFSDSETCIASDPTHRSAASIRAGTSIRMLDIKSMTSDYLAELLGHEFRCCTSFGHSYHLPVGAEVSMGYVVAERLAVTDEPVAATAEGSRWHLADWSSLAIGVGADKVLVAPGPIPVGGAFPIRSAKHLDLGEKKQLETLLRLFSESADGHSVDRGEVLTALHLGTAVSREEAKQVVGEPGLHSLVKKAKVLSNTVSDNTRKLRDLLQALGIRCSGKRPLFGCRGDVVVATPRIRALISDGQRTCFGESPREKDASDSA